MQSGSCVTQTRAATQTASLAFAKQAGCPEPATAVARLRALPEQTLLDASTSYQPLFTSGGPELPLPAAQAVASGHYNRVPLLMGTNHNEGRTFTQGFTALTEQQADQLISQLYGAKAPAILARYPWNSYPSPYTASYMIGDIWTDSGFLLGRLHRLRRPQSPGPAPVAALHQRSANVPAAGRPDPDHHGRHLRGRAPVLLLERRGACQVAPATLPAARRGASCS